MKKLLTILLLATVATGAIAQGTINFVNASGPQVRYDVNNLGPGGPTMSYPLLPTTAGLFCFALLTAPIGTTDPWAFTFAGVYATNLAAAGIIRGPSVVPGWATGTSRSFEVAGWDVASGGWQWNPQWPSVRPAFYFGLSVIGSGFAGGIDPVTGGPIPALNIFGGSGIPTSSQFVLFPFPEPGSAALAALGAAVLLIFRRRGRLGPG